MAASRIEFYVSCKGLRSSDVLSRSDPFGVAYIGRQDSGGNVTYTRLQDILNSTWRSAVGIGTVTVVEDHMIKNVSITSKGIKSYEPDKVVEQGTVKRTKIGISGAFKFWEKEEIPLENEEDIIIARTMEPWRELVVVELRDSKYLEISGNIFKKAWRICSTQKAHEEQWAREDAPQAANNWKDYNSFMGTVDIMDQYCGTYLVFSGIVKDGTSWMRNTSAYLMLKYRLGADSFEHEGNLQPPMQVVPKGEIGRTETIGNTSDPEFTHQFLVDYFFNETQHIRVRILDEDYVTLDDDLGRAEFTLGKLMSSPGRSIAVHLRKRSGSPAKGTMTVRAEEVSSCADSCRLTIRGINLPNMDGPFGKSDPYFTISRVREDDQWQQVLKSETIMNNTNPLWEPQEVSVQALCNGDYRRPLRIDVWDWDRNGNHDFLGSMTTSLHNILESQGHETKLQSPARGRKKSKGHLRVEVAEIFKEPTLLEFLAGGLQISMMVAIDFTGSNGEPRFPYSLHHIDPTGKMNQYQQAIVSIGAIIEQYDYDKKFPVYGFGGEVGFDGFNRVSHCFPICRISQAGEAEEADGVGGILTAYSAALHNIRFSGPTLFQEVLQTAMARASQPSTQFDQRYDILVILTDGIINDMTQTVECLVAASNLPLSVVIVGVGHANFTDMSVLDGDGGVLKDSANNVASRDIVQFVPFSKYPEGDMIGSRLAADTMAEIPGQLLQYFKSKKIVPNPPRPPMPLPPASSPGGAAGYDPPPAYTP